MIPYSASERESAIVKLMSAAKPFFGDRITLAASVREQHAHDESYHAPQLPDVVAFAQSTEEIATLVRLCTSLAVPLIPFGAGTSLEGQVQAVRGGVSVDLSQMNRILRVSPDDFDCTVEAGVRRKQLNLHLRDTGLFFPIDPGPDATIGGMTATRASGTNAVRYGTMRENVMALTVVTSDGSIVKTASRARKSSAGYDLTRVFVGSEGTLGIITEITLRLHGIPEAVIVGSCVFSSEADAVNAAILTLQAGITPARIEFLDDRQIAAINLYSRLELPVRPTLFFELHGTTAGVAEQAAMLQAVAEDNGGQSFRQAHEPAERERLWQARHDAYYAAVSQRTGARGWATDVCVPISRIAECIVETKEDLKQCTIPACIVGHVGDGNFHVVFAIDPDDKREIEKVKEFSHRLARRAIAMDGTCTGEHGVGLGKVEYMSEEHGEALVCMQLIKSAFDPRNIFNPGKLLPLGPGIDSSLGDASASGAKSTGSALPGA